LTNKIWPDIFRLDNNVVVVTGAGLIGSKIIRGLAEAGAKVIISDINEDLGKKLENELKEDNLDVNFKKMDITREDSVDDFINICNQEFGGINALVNTAYPRTDDWGKRDQLLNYNSFKQNIKLHLGGYYLTSIKTAELMKKQGGGSIINLGSIYGISAPNFSIYEGTEMTTPIAYSAIKGGINMLTKYIASYYGKYQVRANVIAPGGVYDNQPDNFVSNYKKKVPLNRMASADDIVGAAIFLVSNASSYITGHILVIDGGFSI